MNEYIYIYIILYFRLSNNIYIILYFRLSNINIKFLVAIFANIKIFIFIYYFMYFYICGSLFQAIYISLGPLLSLVAALKFIVSENFRTAAMFVSETLHK